MTAEVVIEEYLVKKARAAGGDAIKLGHSGWPDRIVVVPTGRRVGFVETKATGGKARPLQLVRLAFLKKLGLLAEAIDSKSGVDEFMGRLTCG